MVNGVNVGLIFCLIGVIYGDEFNGIEIICWIMYDLELEKLFGWVVGVFIVNLFGF